MGIFARLTASLALDSLSENPHLSRAVSRTSGMQMPMGRPDLLPTV